LNWTRDELETAKGEIKAMEEENSKLTTRLNKACEVIKNRSKFKMELKKRGEDIRKEALKMTSSFAQGVEAKKNELKKERQVVNSELKTNANQFINDRVIKAQKSKIASLYRRN
jgi:hypothetical protein